jgi:hypothetical protein
MHQSNQKDPTPATVTIGPRVLLARRREMSFRRERRPDIGNSQDTLIEYLRLLYISAWRMTFCDSCRSSIGLKGSAWSEWGYLSSV